MTCCQCSCQMALAEILHPWQVWLIMGTMLQVSGDCHTVGILVMTLNLNKNLFVCNSHFCDLIIVNFCTEHGSFTAMLCTKFDNA